MPNPWDMNSPLARRIASVGKHALETGKVSPEEAHANLLAMTNPQSSSPLDMNAYGGMGDQPYGPPSEYAPGQAAGSAGRLYQDLGADAIAGIKGAKVESTKQDNSTYRRGSSRLLTKSPEQYRRELMQAQGLYPKITGYEQARDDQGRLVFGPDGKPMEDRDQPISDFNDVTVDENDPVRQQQQGLNRMEDLLGLEAQANKGRPTMDYTPLSALADAENARHGVQTNLAASSVKPSDPTGKFMAYADDIQKRRGEIQKAIQEGVKLQKGGSTTDQLMQAILLKEGAGQNNPTFDRQQMWQDRMDNMNHQRVLTALRSDKNLGAKLVQYQNLQNALSNFTNVEPTAQSFDELQQAVRANLGIKNGSGIGERERTMMNSLGLSADRIAQIINGTPEYLSHNDAFGQHIKQLAAQEKANIEKQFQSRLNFVAGGNASMYQRRPDLQDDLNQMLVSGQAQIEPPKPASSGTGHKAAPKKGAGAAKSISPFSKEAIDAELKRRGGQ